jgi:DNA polymerase-3 subunit beta
VLIDRTRAAWLPRHRHRDPDHRRRRLPRRETARVTVGARKLLDILRALPDGARSRCSSRTSGCWSRPARAASPADPAAEDFPRLAKPAGESAQFKLAQKALRRLLSLVQYAMAQQDIRYYLNGLLMVVEESS